MSSKGNIAQQLARQNRGHRDRTWLDATQCASECKIIKPADPKLIKQNQPTIDLHNYQRYQRRFEIFEGGPKTVKK